MNNEFKLLAPDGLDIDLGRAVFLAAERLLMEKTKVKSLPYDFVRFQDQLTKGDVRFWNIYFKEHSSDIAARLEVFTMRAGRNLEFPKGQKDKSLYAIAKAYLAAKAEEKGLEGLGRRTREAINANCISLDSFSDYLIQHS